MTQPRYGRKDGNQRDFEKAFAAMGYSWRDMSSVGSGFPDMIVAKHKVTILIEVKRDGKQSLRPGQEIFRQTWKGHIITAHDPSVAVKQCEKIIHGRRI